RSDQVRLALWKRSPRTYTCRSYNARVVDEPVRGGFPERSFYSLPGVEQARAWLRGLAPESPLARLIAARVTQVGSGSVTFSVPASPWLQQPDGSLELRIPVEL